MKNLIEGNVSTVAEALYRAVGSPYALEKLKALENGDWSVIFKSQIAPSAYENASSFAYDYACHAFLKKYEVASQAKQLHAEAIVAFKGVEQRLKSVNRNLRYRPCNNGVEGIISYARRKIYDILGPFDIREFALRCDWGPGATSTLTSEDSTVDKKILEPRLSCTGRALRYARAYLEHSSRWMEARIGHSVAGPCSPLSTEFNIVEPGRFATVPKDAYRRRSIDIQPTLNLFLQKGLGAMIRRRLKREGIDLDDQSRNQELARLAYSEGYATLDLEAASDSVSKEIVRLLLPTDWFQRLDDLRTHSINIDGEVLMLEKFSAMGNGFTFELESLIFYALCWAVVRAEAGEYTSPIAVYGDDIVIKREHSERVITVLTEVGFIVNDSKSFTEGNFYESCGKHYFKGFDVTPPFQKEGLRDPMSGIRCANRLWRWAFRMGGGRFLDDIARESHSVASRIAFDLHRRSEERRKSRLLRRVVKTRRGSGRVESGMRPLPLQPWWLEGDGGLIVNIRFHFDENGIARFPLYVSQPKLRAAEHSAIYGEALRKYAVANVSGLVPLEIKLRRLQHLGLPLDLDDRKPTYGMVSPRSEVKWSISMRRVYRMSHEVPQFLSLTN